MPTTTILIGLGGNELRRTTARLLEGAGYQVTEAVDANETFRLAKELRPALLLLDSSFPDGEARGMAGELPTLVISTTARTKAGIEAAAWLNAGASDVLFFPMSDEEVLARVRACLERVELAASLRDTERRLKELLDRNAGPAGESESSRIEEQRYRDLVETSHDLIWAVDAQGRLTFLNQACRKTYGREPEEMIGRNFTEFIPPEQREADIKGLQSFAAETGELLDYTSRILHKDGHVVVMSANARVLRNAQGRIVGSAGISRDITEKLRTEEAARNQEFLLYNAQRIGRMGSWSMDLRNGRLVWSDATCDLFGIRPEDFQGTVEHFRSFVLEEDLETIDAIHAAISASAPLLEAEYRIRRADGAIRWMYERGNVQFDATGTAVTRLGMVMDITEARAARETIAHNAALLRIAGHAARLGGWTLELFPEQTLSWSDEVRAIHEVPPGETPSLQEALNFYPAEYQPEVIRHLALCQESGTSFDFEAEILTTSGRSVWIRSIGEAVRDADGRIVRLQGAFQDISDRKQATEALRSSEERFRLLAKATNDAIWDWDLQSNEMWWNEGYELLFGYNPDDVESTLRSFTDFVHPDDVQQVMEALNNAISGNESGWSQEYRIRHKDGGYVDVHERGHILQDAKGRPARVIAGMTDLTEKRRNEIQRKALEQQMLRAQRMESIGTLAGGIAHDLNNVLVPILMSVNLLKQDEKDRQKLDTLRIVELSAKRGADMIRQVLTFARGMDGERIEVQLPAVVDDVMRIVHETFPKNIRIVTRLGPELWKLLADPTQLQQVLMNLCVNARDAMPDGGQLTVSAYNILLDDSEVARNIEAIAGTYVRIDIEDTGSGIPEEILDKIFDPFFTTKDIGKGTGLGLATSLTIVRSHHGFVQVDSTPGAGSCFRIYLPAQASSAPRAAAQPDLETPRGNGETILVVDDEEAVRMITRRILESFGYTVRLASDGAEAVAIYAAEWQRIDLVLTDMMMPVMDGAATARELLRLNPRVRIIGVSGVVTERGSGRSPGSGLADMLPKPYSSETLLNAIRRALQAPA